MKIHPQLLGLATIGMQLLELRVAPPTYALVPKMAGTELTPVMLSRACYIAGASVVP